MYGLTNLIVKNLKKRETVIHQIIMLYTLNILQFCQLYLNNYTLAGKNILYFVLAVYYCRLNENRKFCKLIFKQNFPNVLNLCKQIVLHISDMWTM